MKLLHTPLLTVAILSPTLLAITSSAAASKALSFYGHAHASVDLLDDSDDTNIGLSSNSSRFGLKGDITLSKDYSVLYQAEWHVSITGEKDWSQRNRYLGIKGPFGQIKFGRLDTPVKKIGRSVDLFWSSQLGENRSLTSVNGFDSRYNNGIVYANKFGQKFHFTGAFYTDAKDDDRIDDNDGSVISGSLTYSTDTVMLAAGYELVNGKEADNAATLADPQAPAVENASAIRLVGSIKAGAHRWVGFYEAASDVGGVDGRDNNIIGFGWALTSAPYTFKAQSYFMNAYDNADDTGGSLIAVGIDHAHSKKITSYVTLGMISNDDQASLAIIGVGHDDKIAAMKGESNAGLSVGMRIKF